MPPMALTGVVTKVGFMQKTATVTVSRYMVHRKTHKRIERSKKYLTHDAENCAALKLGDTVLIRNCPPISARKRFRLEKIIKSPETEWQKAHANVAASGHGEGESQSSLDPEDKSILGQPQEMVGKSDPNIAQESVGQLDSSIQPSNPSS